MEYKLRFRIHSGFDLDQNPWFFKALSLNINAYVIDIHDCPENVNCIAPDRIAVSENLPPADTLYITAIEPSQFQLQKQYTISLEVTAEEGRERHDIRLLGYSFIE